MAKTFLEGCQKFNRCPEEQLEGKIPGKKIFLAPERLLFFTLSEKFSSVNPNLQWILEKPLSKEKGLQYYFLWVFERNLFHIN